jgi:YegS/Rv2252/BmrU family lipid kinase
MALVDAPGDAQRIARERAAAFNTVAAVGGDGTVSEVATGIWESGAKTRLAILPAGTGNDAGHAFGVSSWEDGLKSLTSGRERVVDAVEAVFRNGDAERRRLCLVGAGIGFPAAVARRASRRVKRLLGPLAYYYGALVEAAAYRPQTMRVTVDGETREGRILLCAVVNAERTSRQTMRMAPGARVDDGLLDVLLVSDASKLRLLLNMGRLRNGTHVELPEVTHMQAVSVTVDGPPAPLMIDGDPLGQTPAAFRILPGALTVRVP